MLPLFVLWFLVPSAGHVPWLSLFAWRLLWLRGRPGPHGRACHPRPPSASCRARPKPAWVVGRLIHLKALMPQAGCRAIALIFNRRYAHRRMTVSKSFVAQVLRRHAYEIALVRRRIKRRVPRPAPINQVWGLDLTGKQDVHGTVHAILGLIDHGSRRLLALRLCPHRNALILLGHVFLMMGRYGVPQALRTDNDRLFTGRLFRWGLALAGVRHQRTTPGCPWQNGRIERLFLTLKSELDALAVHSGTALASMLGEFKFWYNAARPHQHLGGATPMEVWRGIDPFQGRPRGARFVSFWEGRLRGYVMRW